MAHLLGAEALHLEYPNTIVFDSVSLGVSAGDRIGIVGRNGDGKSSLLNILLGDLEPTEGRVTKRNGLRVALLSQVDDLNPEATVAQSIVGNQPEHVWAGDPKIRDVLAGLVADVEWDALVAELSGGQRRRVALAALLVGDWDVIGLDEPTNHLDVEGITWLANHLKNRWDTNAGGLLVITHDRWFLDEVATATWEVHNQIVEPFEGGYAAYVLQRIERDRIAAVTESKRRNIMRKELAWLRRGAPARTSKPKFRIEAANQLISDVPELRNRVELTKLATARLGKDVVELENVSLSYGENKVLRGIDWNIGPGERTGILGANGAGKSSLLGLISGSLQPTNGRIKRGKTVQLAILDQEFHELDEIGEDLVREVLARHKTFFNIDGKDVSPTQLLERLGFSRDHLSSRVNELSGGQRRRVQLLMVLLSEPNFLILDEPTNDVDTDMLAALEDVLDSWPGTLIVVSHDRYLLERVTDQQYAILDGKLRHLPGGVDEYLRIRAAQNITGSGTKTAVSFAGTSPLSGPELRAMGKELSSIERRLEKIASEIEKIHEKLATHDQSDYTGLQRFLDQIRALEVEASSLEERWLGISETIDS